MEHDICKNIPVIMMSSQDSVTTVYKCMMRGAADYLVKPIRKNELQHLWQHVWRRQSSTSRADGGQSDNVESQKVEATAENNAASNHSSGYMACLDRDKEFIEKGSGSQSSCTKPDVEADSSEIQPNQDSNMDMMKVVVPENITATEKVVVMQENAYDGLAVAASSHSQSKDTGPEIHEWNAKITMAAYDDDAINFNPGIEAINLIGAFSSHHDGSYMDSLNFGTRKFDAPPELGLSLRRSESCFTSQRSEERHSMLNHSDGSAFSRYVNKPVNRVAMRPENLPILEGEFEKNPGREVSCVVKAYNLDNRNPAKGSPDRVISLTDAQSGQSECIPSHHQGRVVPAPIPVSDVRFENFRTELSAVQPEAYCTQSGPSPGPSPMSAVQHKSFLRVDSFQQSSCGNNSPERVKDTPDLIASNSSNQSRQNHNRDLKFDSLEDRGHISPATGRSITSNLCNGGTLTHRHSTDCGSVSGSNGNVNHVAVARYADEKRSGEESSQRLILREAALAKFRLKRKDRCYEKKVRSVWCIAERKKRHFILARTLILLMQNGLRYYFSSDVCE
ncbi:hypothetical protein SAY86_010869 [Trapa natans]|uniref:Response regulatory domain-containing protein n=1 Tax=Trapa natans TaxID=22666 RepID=A0AAN7R4L6_TRANT|nr:hypothetical protein SAY86_010869 [Trapa natans]